MLYVDPSDFGLSFSDIQQEAPYARVDAAHSGAKRVRRSMSEDVGFVDGRHFTTYVDDVKTLRRYGADEQAEQLLLRLIDASEQEAHAKGWGVAPWYYEQLAIIYHKRRDHMDEIAILERFAQKPHAPGADPPKLLARLEKTRAEHPVA
jgi:hypothetical protein